MGELNASYALMFRSENIGQWNKEVSDAVRRKAEELSLNTLSKIVAILKPKFLYAAGFGTFKMMQCIEEKYQIRGFGTTKNGIPRQILKYGTFVNEGAEMKVISSLHPSGSRYSVANRRLMSTELSKFWNKN